ncbi:MAG: polysaccharide biosynthesis protein [Oscillospiraceae bacterium]|nr:polysaccharide biosynthesis protein [Oscillospiraceae bacterium]
MQAIGSLLPRLLERLELNNKTKRVRVLMFLLADILSINLSGILALYLRFEFQFQSMVESGFLSSLLKTCLPNTILLLLLFAMLHLYVSVWAHAGVMELLNIFLASAASILLQLMWKYLFKIPFPKSYLVLAPFLLGFFLVATRFSYRFLRRFRLLLSHKAGKRTMLIGAGSAGASALREFQFSIHSRNKIVCIIDDNPAKKGKRLMGVRISGGRDQIVSSAERYHIEEIIFAIPSMSFHERQEILSICQQTGCKLKTLPGIFQVANGDVNIKQIRDVDIYDLLGRPEITVDSLGINDMIMGKTVLVTGGGGSIGSELCRQLAAKKPAQLIIFDIYENNAYEIQQELLHTYPDLTLTVLIGSVRDADCIRRLMFTYHPNLVFHAAAHKHVPLMEDSPAEAIKNNVFGTLNVAQSAAEAGTERFILISTDKAVNPTNVMGASKRMCEMIIQMLNGQYKTIFSAVRFGNVLGSNGSVIPLFRKQIAAGGPVTVTHPDINRFFMTIPEAVSLVLQACAFAKGGDIHVLDMGDPVKIDDLARKMILLSGFVPEIDIPIVYTGLRPGEKLYEEVLMDEEGLRTTENRSIFIGSPIQFDQKEFLVHLQQLRNADPANHELLRQLIAQAVPTYHPAQ